MAVPLAWYRILTKLDPKDGEGINFEKALTSTAEQTKWMHIPLGPRGIDYLRRLDQVIISERFGRSRTCANIRNNKQFLVKNEENENVYYVREHDSPVCDRIILGRLRPYRLSIYDHEEKEVMRFFRPCAFFLEKMEVSCPPGELIGYIKQRFNICIPKYVIKDEDGEIIARVECHADNWGLGRKKVLFKVFTRTGMQQIGFIAKKFGIKKDTNEDVDVVAVGFGANMTIKLKTLVLGAGFLIDMLYY